MRKKTKVRRRPRRVGRKLETCLATNEQDEFICDIGLLEDRNS